MMEIDEKLGYSCGRRKMNCLLFHVYGCRTKKCVFCGSIQVLWYDLTQDAKL